MWNNKKNKNSKVFKAHYTYIGNINNLKSKQKKEKKKFVEPREGFFFLNTRYGNFQADQSMTCRCICMEKA